MTAEDLLSRLESVRARGPGRWMAKSPTREERTPSLSIREADDRILLYDFGGASIEEICRSLGISPKDLFYERTTDPKAMVEAQRQRASARQHREVLAHADGVAIDALREAEAFVRSARGIYITGWSHDRLDGELNALADAYTLLEREDLYERV